MNYNNGNDHIIGERLKLKRMESKKLEYSSTGYKYGNKRLIVHSKGALATFEVMPQRIQPRATFAQTLNTFTLSVCNIAS